MESVTSAAEKQGGGLHVGVDIGGTFTDTVAIGQTGEVLLSKVPTTPQDQAIGFMNGVEQAGISLPDIAWIVHGTTVGTNATLERNGAKCGLITTKGFRDLLELGRRERPQLFGMKGQHEPLISRDLRMEVVERIDAEGNVVVPLDADEVIAAAEELKKRGVTSLLICFLNSYANPDHERIAAEAAAKVWDLSLIHI